MHQHAAYSDRLGGLHDAQRAIAKQRTPYSLSVMGVIDGKPSKDGHGNWLGHVAPEAAGCCCSVYCAGGQRVVSNDRFIGAYDEAA